MKILHNIFLIAVPLLLFSCDKSLDLAPKDQVSDASFWSTTEHFRLAANDFYFSLKGPNYVDINSDIAFGPGTDAVSNGSFLPPENSPVWDNAYEGIRATNYLLDKAEETNLEGVQRYKGEALFFRAYNYWNLVSNFGGVPIIEEVLDVTSEDLYKTRASQKEVINFILNDLEEAIGLLPMQNDLSGDELGRVTAGAALALRARAALYQGTWMKYHENQDGSSYLDLAITSAESILSSDQYSLYTGMGDQSYKYLFILEGDDSEEVILARRYYANRATHNWTRELWFNRMVPVKKMADMYLAKDGLPIEQSDLFQGYEELNSEFENRDPRMAMTFIEPGSEIFGDGGEMIPTYPGFTGTNATRTGYMLRKFLGETLEATQFQGQYDFKEFRLGEVLLILAEAIYEKNGQVSDADLDRTINLLRSRVNMPPLTNAFVSANNLDMLGEIRRERTVELAYEGFRRDDLRRWKLAEEEMPEAIKGVKFVGTAFQERYPDLEIGVDIRVDDNGFIIAEPASSRQFLPRHYLMPIPLQQIQLSNGTLEQNTGW